MMNIRAPWSGWATYKKADRVLQQFESSFPNRDAAKQKSATQQSEVGQRRAQREQHSWHEATDWGGILDQDQAGEAGPKVGSRHEGQPGSGLEGAQTDRAARSPAD